MDGFTPATLGEGIAAQPPWLQGWVLLLVLAHLGALAFVAHRADGKWKVRIEPIAIVVSFLAAGAFMSWLFERVGYVRLLGLAHLVFWTPVYVWVLSRRGTIGGPNTLYGKYLLFYLVIAGISLVVDAIDVVRYLAG